MKTKAIFLDRDGVINKEVNYLHKIKDFEFTEGCIEALKAMQSHGYLLFIITNQAGIGRGYYSEDDFHQLNNWMLAELKNMTSPLPKYVSAHTTQNKASVNISLTVSAESLKQA